VRPYNGKARRRRRRSPPAQAVGRVRHDRGRPDEAPSATARRGQWREEHRVGLAPAVALDARDHAKIGEGDRHGGPCTERSR
jgi:hypothetical protein